MHIYKKKTFSNGIELSSLVLAQIVEYLAISILTYAKLTTFT